MPIQKDERFFYAKDANESRKVLKKEPFANVFQLMLILGAGS